MDVDDVLWRPPFSDAAADGFLRQSGISSSGAKGLLADVTLDVGRGISRILSGAEQFATREWWSNLGNFLRGTRDGIFSM